MMKGLGRLTNAVVIMIGIGLSGLAAAASSGVTHTVRCGTGQTLAKALKVARPGDSIHVVGTCREQVDIVTNRITITGGDTAVIEGSGATVPPTEFDAVITIDGAHGVTLEGLTVRNGTGEGIMVKHGASVRLERVNANDNGNTGVVISTNAIAELTTVTSRDNLFGLDVFDGATALMLGPVALTDNQADGMVSGAAAAIELRGAQLDVSNNGAFGMVLAGVKLNVFAFSASQGSSITANGNGLCGVALVEGGRLAVVSAPSFYGSGINVITANDNDVCGMFLPDSGFITNVFGAARFVITGNPVGLRYGNNSGGTIFGGLEVTGNGTGVLADGAGAVTLGSFAGNPSFITGNGTDVDVSFGSRLTFCDISVGAVVDDGTALTRFLPICPPLL